MIQEVAFNTKEYLAKYVTKRVLENVRTDYFVEHEHIAFGIKFACGKQVRTDSKELEPEHRSTKEEGLYGIKVEAGYANLTAAFIGWVSEQGWASVLAWWNVKAERAVVYGHVPTNVINNYVIRRYNDTYINVMPLPKEFNQHQVRFAVSRMSGDERYRFREAVDNFDELAWLSSIPPTKEEVHKAVKLPYEDVNFAPLMQQWG